MSTKSIIGRGACMLIILAMFGNAFGQGVIGPKKPRVPLKSTGFNTSQYENLCYSKVVNEWGRRDTLPFRMLKPLNYNASGTPYPIIIMFHGRGEAGTDNNFQLLHGGNQHLSAVNSGRFNGFVVFPQEPFGYWANSPTYDAGGNQASPYLKYAWEMIDLLITQYNIDPDRIVVHGLSAGGTAAWATMYNRPDLVAAALPMSAPGDPSQAHKISPASIWLAQGGVDTNPIPAISTNMLNTLASVGCDTTSVKTNTTKPVKYALYPGVGHSTWNYMYAEPDFFPFILRQNKRNVKILGRSALTAGQTTNLGISAGMGEYQWYRDGILIDGAKSYRLDGVNQAGNYYVMFRRKASNPTWVASSTVTITCASCGNVNPTVNITAPVTNTVVTAPASVTITANALDVDGTVSKVEFYNGATLLGTDFVAPYNYQWSGIAAGTYSVIAKATDNSGGTATSTVTLKVNALPVVSLTSPVNNSSFTAPATLSLTASASDADGTISKVEFFNGAILLGTVTSAPFSYNWANVTAGAYALTAKATDNVSGTSTSSIVNVIVNTPVNQLPSVSLTSPANNATFTSPANVSITASASDVDGTISKVEFFNGAALLGTSTVAPYTYTWPNVAAGTYSITAKATDNAGDTRTSSVVNITVNVPANQKPVVSLTSPLNNATYTTPATITLTASASDADGTITSVAFFRGNMLLGNDFTAPYSLEIPNAAVGAYSFTARARDNSGDSTTSAVVSVSVSDPVNQLPTVSLTAPLNNASFVAPASVSIAASASDADGTITKVEFFNGANLVGTSTVAPYVFNWLNVAAGTYIITAKATDNGSAVRTSAPVTVTVTAPVNQLPTISLTAPGNNASYTAPATVLLSASASDVDGAIAKVEFFNGTTLLGTSTVAPYSITWPNVAVGTYSLTAKATDNVGAATTSTSVSIVVNASGNQPPLLTITAPVASAVFIGTQHVSIEATASDPGGSVSKVEFFLNDVAYGTDQWAPYQMTAWNVQPGTYTVTVKATDNLGAVSTQSVPLIINTSGYYITSTVSCLTPGQAVEFELDASQRVNATSYSWWFSGPGLGLTATVAEGFKGRGTTGADITSGDVCVGVNYTSGYKTFCKAINKCVSAREDNEPEASTVSNNGATTLSVNSSKDIASISIVTVTGAVVQTVNNVSKGQELELFQSIPAGLHLVYIQYADGTKDIQKVLKAQ